MHVPEQLLGINSDCVYIMFLWPDPCPFTIEYIALADINTGIDLICWTKSEPCIPRREKKSSPQLRTGTATKCDLECACRILSSLDNKNTHLLSAVVEEEEDDFNWTAPKTNRYKIDLQLSIQYQFRLLSSHSHSCRIIQFYI